MVLLAELQIELQTCWELSDSYTNTLNLLAVQGERKQSIILPLVGGFVEGGIVDGAVDWIACNINQKFM